MLGMQEHHRAVEAERLKWEVHKARLVKQCQAAEETLRVGFPSSLGVPELPDVVTTP